MLRERVGREVPACTSMEGHKKGTGHDTRMREGQDGRAAHLEVRKDAAARKRECSGDGLTSLAFTELRERMRPETCTTSR